MQVEHTLPSGREPQGEHHAAEVRRITWAGLVVNVLLSLLKLGAGIWGHSQAVVADAVHGFSDTSSDAAVLIGVRYWSKPADKSHPHGHRRIETLVTVGIGLLLAGVAAALTYNAIVTIPEKHAESPDWIAFAAAVLSIVIKEGLYRWTALVGRRIRSSAVSANAWHHRSDALSSVPAALAVAVAAANPDWYFVDHVGAVVVSLLILQAAWRIARPALSELTDRGAPPEVVEVIRRITLDTKGVKEAHAFRTRYLGTGLAVDLHVLVDGRLTVKEGHDIAEKARSRLLEEGPDVIDVVVHFGPAEYHTHGQGSHAHSDA